MTQVVNQEWICSKCYAVIFDEAEYNDNNGVCDECYSLPIKKRLGILKKVID
jgi:ribosomal protein L40E